MSLEPASWSYRSFLAALSPALPLFGRHDVCRLQEALYLENSCLAKAHVASLGVAMHRSQLVALRLGDDNVVLPTHRRGHWCW